MASIIQQLQNVGMTMVAQGRRLGMSRQQLWRVKNGDASLTTTQTKYLEHLLQAIQNVDQG